MSSKIKINLDSLKSRREWRRHKVTDGHNVFRVLPPFKETSNGYPYKKWQIVWGLVDPESNRSRPFASSITSEKRCPIAEYVEQLKKRSETIKAKMQAAGESEDDIKDRLSVLNKLVSDLSLKTIYVYNAANQSGEVGLLELKSTAHKKMKTEMNNYINDYNQDPTSLNSEESDSGVWFDVVRVGQGRDTEYDVKRVSIKTKNPTTGKISFEDDRSPLPDNIVENYDNMAYDLSAVYQVKSYDELSDILQANMPLLIEMCPDADLDADIVVGKSSKKSTSSRNDVIGTVTTAPKSISKPVSKVNLNLGLDEDDEDEEQQTSAKRATAASKSSASSLDDDDFLAEADALLNS